MGRPSRAAVYDWDLPTLQLQATSLIAGAQTLRDNTQALLDTAQGAGNWHGESQRACEERALSDQTEINKLAADVNRAGNILNNTAVAISPNRDSALMRCYGLEHDEFAVGEDWTVTDIRNYAAALADQEVGSVAYNTLIAERDGRANDAINATLSLQALADQMGIDDQAGADALANAFGNADINAPITSGLSRQQAARDVQALTDGVATPQQRARFAAATDLTPEQRDALIRGGDAVIPQGQFEYLQGIYTELGTHGLDGFTRFGGDDPALKSALADGLQILSNPHVRTDQPIDNWFGQTLNPTVGRPVTPGYVRGGLSLLPSAIRDPLTLQSVKNSQVRVTSRYGNSHTESSFDFPTLRDLGTISDILAHGDPNSQLGSDMDRALIARSSEIAGAATSDGTYGTRGDVMSFDRVRDILTKTTHIAGNDHIAVHDALMTGRHGGPSATSAMPDTIDVNGNVGKYDAGLAMTNLLAFDWDDGKGGADSGPNNMFKWIGDSAAAAEGAPPNAVAESWRAGESGSELTRIIAENSKFLVDIDGKAALGEVNPELTRTVANSLAPQLGDLAGARDDLFTTNGADKLETGDQMNRLFQVLDTDVESGRTINTAASQTMSYLEYKFGFNPEDNQLGELVGRIENSMYSGLAIQSIEDADDNRYAVTKEYTKNGYLFDSAKSIVGSIPGIPQGGKAILDILAPALKYEMLGAPPNLNDIEAGQKYEAIKDALDKATSPTDRYKDLLSGYAQANPAIRSDPLFARYFDDKGSVNLEGIDTDDFRGSVRDLLHVELGTFMDARADGENNDWGH